MSKVMESTKTLGPYETMRIGFENYKFCLEVSGNGNFSFGEIGKPSIEFNLFTEIHARQTQSIKDQEKTAKLDHLRDYLDLLFQAQRSEHDVHKEITEALKQYKEEAGI